jgi:hypothetical protein
MMEAPILRNVGYDKIPEEGILHSHRREILKSYKEYVNAT